MNFNDYKLELIQQLEIANLLDSHLDGRPNRFQTEKPSAIQYHLQAIAKYMAYLTRYEKFEPHPGLAIQSLVFNPPPLTGGRIKVQAVFMRSEPPKYPAPAGMLPLGDFDTFELWGINTGETIEYCASGSNRLVKGEAPKGYYDVLDPLIMVCHTRWLSRTLVG